MKILSLTLAACLLASAAHAEAPSVAKIGDLPAVFDDLGVAVQTLKTADGRTVHFTDTGEPGFRPVLFMGGTGTSARAFEMTEFLKSMRKQLKLRFITVERNGFGDSPIRAGWGYADYVAEVRAVLDHLQVQRASGVAISGGGPYMAQVAAAMPERLISLHLLAAATQRPPEDAVCKLSADQLTAFMKSQVQNPKTWWGFPKDSPTHKIPGFADRAYDEGARAFYIRGQMGDPAPEVAEVMRYCGPSQTSRRSRRRPSSTRGRPTPWSRWRRLNAGRPSCRTSSRCGCIRARGTTCSIAIGISCCWTWPVMPSSPSSAPRAARWRFPRRKPNAS